MAYLNRLRNNSQRCIGWAAACGFGLACLFGFSAQHATAIPAFAREHRLQCVSCHTVIPQLNVLGEQFREAGYRLPRALEAIPSEKREGEYQARLTPDLRLAERLFRRAPFSLKLTGDLRYQSRNSPRSRAFWDELLLNSGAERRGWSYYVHQHIHKGGHGAKEQYAAWLQWNDLLRSKRNSASLQAGLFELELALSPHTSRVSSLGYLPYAASIGPQDNFALGEPELGLQLRGRVEPDWRYAIALVAGSGLRTRFDGSRGLFVRAARDLRDGPTLGLFLYNGRRSLRQNGMRYRNGVQRLGLDARWRPVATGDAPARLHLFGMLTWGSDDRIRVGDQFREAGSFAGSLGADYTLRPTAVLHGRLEWLQTDLPDGQQDQVRLVAGLHQLLQANFRVTLEGALTGGGGQADELQLFLGGLWAL